MSGSQRTVLIQKGDCSRIKNKKTDTDDYLFTKNEIRKPQKNISPELLASFGRQLTKTEDIRVELHGAVLD